MYDYSAIASPEYPSLSATKAFWTALVEPFSYSLSHRALVTAMQTGLVLSTFDTSLETHDLEQMVTVSVYNWLQILLRSLLLFRESRLYTIIETTWKIPKPQHPNICLRRMCQRIQRQSECQLLSPNFPGQKL